MENEVMKNLISDNVENARLLNVTIVDQVIFYHMNE